MGTSTLVKSLVEEIQRIPCVNSHSHLLPEQDHLQAEADALAFFQHAYPAADLVAAGMPREDLARAVTPGLPLERRWQLFAPYWERVRLTGYSQCILIGFRDLLGFDDLTAETVGPLTDALRIYRRPGLYREVLQRRANIAVSVLNMEDLVEVDRDFFVPLPRLNRFSMLRSAAQVAAIERDYGVTIGSLADHVASIRSACRQWKEAGVAGVKLSQSYHRRMDFRARDEADAARIFDGLLRGDYAGLDAEAGRLLEDYLVFACCRAATEERLTIQFHLGIRAGNNGSLEGCSPAPLTPLLQAFPAARFDLSHAGFPYLREAAVLAKTFANVFLNMSWIHIISPVAAREALREWLQMVPLHKIVAFGDDLQWAETVYGHLQMARRNVAVALAPLIEEGLLSEQRALAAARALFHDNGGALYGLAARSTHGPAAGR